ncbi:MAG TPA: hypothetical protein VGL93_10670 [Streptosporangiaceae bacterium]
MTSNATTTYVLTIVRGEQPDGTGGEFGNPNETPYLADVPDEVHAWFAANGVQEDDPDVWVLVTRAEDVEHAPICATNVIASREITVDDTTEIYSNTGGRGLGSYPLLDRVQELIPDREEAHAWIWSTIDQLAGIGEQPIISERPVRPELLTYNPRDLDVDYWYTISQATADEIVEAITAGFATSDDLD